MSWNGAILCALVAWAATGEVTAKTVFRHGFEDPCLTDRDGDRLADCEEALRGTLPGGADTDGDGISDGDEVLGTQDGLDLPAMGVDPRHKDLLVEIDWDEDARGCGQHSHRPSPGAIEEVRLFYANVPVANVDGVPGINFVADFGQGGVFDGGNVVEVPNGVTSDLAQPFHDVKLANFASDRQGYFRYQLHAHYWEDFNSSSGLADIVGDNSVVTLNCSWNHSDRVRNTVIHELGHNLGLRHGGDTDCNSKPNYNSLMNYNHQFKGIDVTCDRWGDGIDNLGYSDGTRQTLVKDQLVEPYGLCRLDHPLHKPIDWNLNGVIDEGFVSWNGVFSDNCVLSTVSDFDDYAALHVPPATRPGGGAPTPAEASDACPPVSAP